MASAMRVFRKFQSSDGRIKAITASGVLALAAVVALAVGVLPAMAASVDPVPVDWGGGSDACDAEIFTLDGTEQRLPSAARHDFHIQNPKDGEYFGSDGTKITLSGISDSSDESFTFTIEPGSGMAAYDVVVNGGQKSHHYDYDLEQKTTSTDSGLTAPEKENKEGEVHKLSHINLCYDLQPTFFDCGAEAEPAVELGEVTVFTVVEARIFANNENTVCEDKLGFFFADESDPNDDPNVLLDFGDDPANVVAGRMDITKDFGSTSFVDLQYLHDALSGKVDVSWCNIREAKTADLIDDTNEDGVPDASPFADVLDTDEYPTLDAVPGADPVTDIDPDDGELISALACKVFEGENAAGIQHNVIYFEFLDPNFF